MAQLVTRGLLLLLASAALAFADADVRELKRSVKDGLERGDTSAIRDGIRGLADADSAKALDALVDLATDYPVPAVYERVVRALAAFRSEEALARWEKVVSSGSGDFKRRVVLVDATRRRNDPVTTRALAAAIGDRKTEVALVATEVAGERKLVAAVQPLIEQFKTLDTDRHRDSLHMTAVREALLAITGEQFRSAKEWESFWAAKGEGFEPPSRAKRRELDSLTTRTQPKFFGSTIGYNRVVFVIDTSGSMRHGSPARMERVKEQLQKLVSALPEDCQFMLVTYSGYPGNPEKPWLLQTSRGLQRASKRTKKSLNKFIGQLKPDGNTFTLGALRKALAVKDAEAIILLSDGQPEEPNPATGRNYSEREILGLIATLNRFKRRRIDCFGLGGGGDTFLEALAKQEGGTFKGID